MGESDVMAAERLASARAVLFFVMAALLIVSEVFALEDVEHFDRLIVWLVMVGLFALNLTPFGAWLRPGRVTALLNDETTREHRRNSYTAGFWAALGSAAALAVVTSFEPLSGPVVARMIITAAIAAALICFGVQERRAAA